MQCNTAIGVAVLLPFLGVSSLNFGPLATAAFFLAQGLSLSPMRDQVSRSEGLRGSQWRLLPYLKGMARDNEARKVASYNARGKSVMFSAHFEDGRTGYFVIQGHGTSEENYLALSVAQERQRSGELPEGVIRAVKRVR